MVFQQKMIPLFGTHGSYIKGAMEVGLPDDGEQFLTEEGGYARVRPGLVKEYMVVEKS